MSADPDPLSMVYSALWDMAEATPAITSHVKLRNRIRYDKADRDPEKRSYVDSDTPELALICDGITGNVCNTSSTSELRCRYSWVIVTGDLRINYRLLPVEWALFVAMHGWRTVLGALLWEGKAFVKSANLLDIQEGIMRPTDRQEGPRGWASVWGVQLAMYFSIQDIEALRS